ncbi:SPOR domain-containing protein [Sphingomonas sp. ZT3P38]|uniref:SPOR domain-containing protein n=1 Tax=Parasphingomonas zepuensis TaxID=3096161 RepID=UPI002FCB32E2
MRKTFRPAASGLAVMILAVASPAWGDVKAGVDAWRRGDYRKAVEEWRPAASAGEADAQFNLAQAYRLGRGVPADLAQAERWFREAALQGQSEAGINYGLTLFQNGKREEALPWLEQAVARGDPRAQLALGTMLYTGDGVDRDWPRAYALLTRAAAAGQPRATELKAQMDEHVSLIDRRAGLALASRYAAAVPRSVLPSEILGQGSEAAMQVTDLPPSDFDQHGAEPAPAAIPPPHAPSIAVAAPRPGAIPATAGWRLQFGAFRDEANATALWDRLREQVSALSGLEPVFVRNDTLTKLQAGSLPSSADAVRVCAAVRPTGTPCVPIAPDHQVDHQQGRR